MHEWPNCTFYNAIKLQPMTHIMTITLFMSSSDKKRGHIKSVFKKGHCTSILVLNQ